MLNKKITQLACKIAGIENFDTILKDAFAVIFYSNPNEEFLNDYDKIRSAYHRQYKILLPDEKIKSILNKYFKEDKSSYVLIDSANKTYMEIQKEWREKEKKFNENMKELKKEFFIFYKSTPNKDKLEKKYKKFIDSDFIPDENYESTDDEFNDFSRFLLENKPNLFDLCTDIFILKAFFSDAKWLGEKKQNSFIDCVFYIDTPILLKYLGYDGPEYAKLYDKIFNYCDENKITKKVFAHTVDESWGILYGIKSSINQRRFFAKGVDEYQKAEKYYKSNDSRDVSLDRESLETSIDKMNITTEEKMEVTGEEILTDEKNMATALDAEYKGISSSFPDRIKKDIDSIYAIRSLRNNNRIKNPKSFNEGKYFLLTDNKSFVKVSRKFLQDKESYSEILNVNTVVNEMWTNSGQLDLPRNMYKTRCMVANVISKNDRQEIQRICLSLEQINSKKGILEYIEENPNSVEEISKIYKTTKGSITDIEKYFDEKISMAKEKKEDEISRLKKENELLRTDLEKEGRKNSMHPLISIIIPCYNAERYVESAVRSIIEQTYTNLEILVADDYSTDGTFSILQKLEAEDPRIKIFRNETNLGVVDTLNKLVSKSGGVYIARMDADDISLPDRIARQLAFMQQNPQIDFCGCNAFHINDDGKTIGKTTLPESYDDVKFFLPYGNMFYHSAILARAEVLKQNAYDKDFLHAEDYELWCRLVFTKGMKAANLKERLLKYRINQQGISSRNNQKQMENSARILEKYELVKKDFLDIHKNLFFIHSGCNAEHYVAYLKIVKQKLSSKKFKYAHTAYEKALFHFYSVKQWNLFLYMLFTPLGVYSFFKILKRKCGGIK